MKGLKISSMFSMTADGRADLFTILRLNVFSASGFPVEKLAVTPLAHCWANVKGIDPAVSQRQINLSSDVTRSGC